MRNATVTMSPRLALLVICSLGVSVKRLEDQLLEKGHAPIFIPGFSKPYHFEDELTSRNLIAEVEGLRSALLVGSVDNALLEALDDLGDIDDFLSR